MFSETKMALFFNVVSTVGYVSDKNMASRKIEGGLMVAVNMWLLLMSVTGHAF